MARCYREMGKPWPEVQQIYLDAHSYLPARAEPLYEIAIHWYEEEATPESIAEPLETLIDLILDRFDDNGDGKINQADLALRRRQAIEKSQKIIDQHSQSYRFL